MTPTCTPSSSSNESEIRAVRSPQTEFARIDYAGLRCGQTRMRIAGRRRQHWELTVKMTRARIAVTRWAVEKLGSGNGETETRRRRDKE